MGRERMGDLKLDGHIKIYVADIRVSGKLS
jgi:hypothetical protein